MSMKKFRIYGDNIIECERMAALILRKLDSSDTVATLANLSTLVYRTEREGEKIVLELLPGFNKSGRKRWDRDVFDALRRAGSILDETPDVVITRIEGDEEEILAAIEFCSALQAGNQAWQRSGRAFSVGRTGCPYIYAVDFVKYELDSETRERKALRFPNPLVPYSYLTFSKIEGVLTVQAYIKSEEFQQNGKLVNFPVQSFAWHEMGDYVIARMFGLDTESIEKSLIEKSAEILNFLAGSKQLPLPDPSLPFKKKIAEKSASGHVLAVRDLGEKFGKGVWRDFPFGVIPATRRPAFAAGLKSIYPSMGSDFEAGLSQSDNDLIFCLIKGFKPRGDDNRPDRGILPLAEMLFPGGTEILAFIYGPLLTASRHLLENDLETLARRSGFWNVFLSLSDFLIVDSPIVGSQNGHVELFIDNRIRKAGNLAMDSGVRLAFPTFSARPLSFHEDDVDTVIHYLFAHNYRGFCFEGMCNPPGGDWSGLSLLVPTGKVFRWLSLPRVSGDDKRPDHVLELFPTDGKPVLLVIESKENSADLEENVGTRLIAYVKNLMNFIPNVEKTDGSWQECATKVSSNDFEMVSGAAYLKRTAESPNTVFARTGCDILFVLEPQDTGWKLDVCANPNSENGIKFRDWLFPGNSEIEIK